MSETPVNPSSAEELTRLWLLAQPVVAAFISSQVYDFHAAQDVLQEVAATLVKSFHKYDASKPFLSWAIGIARYKILEFRRSAWASEPVFDEQAIDHIAAACSEMEDCSPVLEALELCLKRVSGKSKVLIDLRYRDGLSSADIAGKVRATINAVDVALHRVRIALRECVRDRLGTREGLS